MFLLLTLTCNCRLEGYYLSGAEAHSESLCVRIKGLEMLVFRKILRTYLMDGPYLYKMTFCSSLGNLKSENF